MLATKQNYKIADAILTVLAEENCTVRQAREILGYVGTQISRESTVQYSAGRLVELANGVDDLAFSPPFSAQIILQSGKGGKDRMRKPSFWATWGRGECMAIKLIGKVAYEINNPPISGGGEFYLTEELLRELEQLQLKAEETIDQALRTPPPFDICSSLAQIESRRNGAGESTDGPNH